MEIILLYLIIIAIILISLTAHELGHFFAGMIFNVNIKEISIGIGPRVFVWRNKKGYDVSLRIFPIMAYVMLDSHTIRDLYKDFPEDKQYYYYMSFIPKNKILLEDAKYWQYMIIMLSGVTVNLFIFFIFWAICANVFPLVEVQIIQDNGSTVIGYLQFTNPFVQFGNSMQMLGNNMIFYRPPGGTGGSFINQIIGIKADANYWLLNFLNMFMSLNLMLGILNLLPIPPLDGYKALSNTYNKIFNKRINRKIETGISIACLALLFYIFVSSILAGFVYWG